MEYYIASQIVDGILECDNATKQRLGQKFARYLNFIEGPRGKDDGIDGIVEHNGKQILFQSKLEKNSIGVDKAKIFFVDMGRHNASIGIYLSGCGFSSEFHKVIRELIEEAKEKEKRTFEVYCLSLLDILTENEKYHEAKVILPPISKCLEVLTEEKLP